MGNIGSQIGNIPNKYKFDFSHAEQTSLPRNLPRATRQQEQQQQLQPRVLPMMDITLKLRSTENGEILQAGGTLTGRVHRTAGGNFMNVKEKVAYAKEMHDGIALADHKERMKKFGSEPDLRSCARQRKPKKKYKAPPRPDNLNTIDPLKKPGLFKTRNESKKQVTNIINNLSPTIIKRNKINDSLSDAKENRHSLPETKNDFASELQEATKKIQAKLNKEDVEDKQEIKKFYFGMDEKCENFLRYSITDCLPVITSNRSTSDVSSDSDEKEGNAERISLRLRPILPKKQPEIPRFSPGSAWKLLCSLDSGSDVEEIEADDDIGLCEEKIVKVSNSAPFIFRQMDLRLSQDKSGDSGISGDGSPKAFNHYRDEKSWTPQQDLGDDSSVDEDEMMYTAPFVGNRPHIFSLSLPRERTGYENCFQTSKRTSSGVFQNGLFELEENFTLNPSQASNWFLSKSAPNSVNGFSSLETYISTFVPNNFQQQRIMYLPNASENTAETNCRVNNGKTDIHKYLKTGYKIEDNIKRQNTKKFSFQNTVRQIERKKLAEMLAKEVEKKEQQRLKEIETMQRIEEEFQRKRLK